MTPVKALCELLDDLLRERAAGALFNLGCFVGSSSPRFVKSDSAQRFIALPSSA